MSSQGRGELRRSDALWWLRAGLLAGLLAAPFLLSGCSVSKFANPFGTGSPDTSASAVTEDRLLETAKADSGSDMPGGLSAHCPQVVAWPRDRLLTIYQPGHVGDNLAVIHRGEITKMARECQIYSDRVVVRYGFAGRVLLGPKGIPGTVNMPVTHPRRRHRAEDARNRQDDGRHDRAARRPGRLFLDGAGDRFPHPGRNEARGLQGFRRLRAHSAWRRLRRLQLIYWRVHCLEPAIVRLAVFTLPPKN